MRNIKSIFRIMPKLAICCAVTPAPFPFMTHVFDICAFRGRAVLEPNRLELCIIFSTSHNVIGYGDSLTPSHSLCRMAGEFSTRTVECLEILRYMVTYVVKARLLQSNHIYFSALRITLSISHQWHGPEKDEMKCGKAITHAIFRI